MGDTKPSRVYNMSAHHYGKTLKLKKEQAWELAKLIPRSYIKMDIPGEPCEQCGKRICTGHKP